jgi:predicted small integral membrane protein
MAIFFPKRFSYAWNGYIRRNQRYKSHIVRLIFPANLRRRRSILYYILPQSAEENGVCALISLIRGFHDLGGYFMQMDSQNAEMLKEAQKIPQKYKMLSVRVSGWNARFVTLNREWQDMIIERTESGI